MTQNQLANYVLDICENFTWQTAAGELDSTELVENFLSESYDPEDGSPEYSYLWKSGSEIVLLAESKFFHGFEIFANGEENT